MTLYKPEGQVMAICMRAAHSGVVCASIYTRKESGHWPGFVVNLGARKLPVAKL
jgi:hypothetical protein